MATPSIAQVSKWLQDPASVTDADAAAIASLIQSYPYFTPAHYFEAARKQKHEPFSPAVMDMLHMHTGNRLLLRQYLQQATGHVVEEAVTKPAPEPVVETVAPAVEPVTETITPAAGAIRETITPAEEQTIQHKDIEIVAEEIQAMKDEPLIQPIYTEDYFLHQGVEVSSELPIQETAGEDEDKSLMVVMSFSEWLAHFKTKSQKAKEEAQDQKALKTMWQKEKLAAAMEEENEEIPEEVFEMAVNSITQEEDLASESLAEIHVKQGKYDKAIDMYRKLSLRNPQKNAYFARRIEEILKEKQS